MWGAASVSDESFVCFLVIRQEIEDIIEGKQPKDNNTLKNAPHTQALVANSEWEYPYSREQAAYPAVSLVLAQKQLPDDVICSPNVLDTENVS